ncbi:pseudouridine synthase [Xylariaceae sp. FL0255]|nr:pseudouridine synthase [Xylariaceae sp. FL0255]
MATHTAMAQGSDASLRCSLEQRLGILHYASLSERRGWHGQSRTRYTDFQVHEITKDGEVVHLSDYHKNPRALARGSPQSKSLPSAPTRPSQQSTPTIPAAQSGLDDITNRERASDEKSSQLDQLLATDISEDDQTTLEDLVGQTTVDELLALYGKIQQDPKAFPRGQNVRIPPTADKAQRSQVHTEIRRIFNGKIDTITDSDGSIKASPIRGGGQQWGNRARQGPRNNRGNPSQSGGGPFLHFTLYKENKDTMEAINHIARVLRLPPKLFGAAGTKDRRAVTSQRVSVKGRNPSSLVVVNERVYNIKIGDFKFAQHPIRLNDHDGNEFVIVLKNCSFEGTEGLSFEEKLVIAKSTVESAMSDVLKCGFINYYGTQRFGTFEIGTQEVGMKILKGDYEGAIHALLSYDSTLLQLQESGAQNQSKRDDIGRAKACHMFLTNQEADKALQNLPPRFHVERALVQHLSKNPTDFPGALMCITRSMRTMYVHAYQSLVWNFVASERWKRFGAQVIKGDIVLMNSSEFTPCHGLDHQVGHPANGAASDDDDIATSEASGLVAHALTDEDVLGGKFSIFDVVLPSPGWDVLYPPNGIGKFYTEFMEKPENGGLDPRDMHRRQRDFSLPGSYRKLMGQLKKAPAVTVQAYSNDLEQLVPTDLDTIHARKTQEAKERSQQTEASSAWHKFAQNVDRIESEESKARIARREAEEAPPSAVRINDTWIQTGLDNGNKRIRVAKHDTDPSDDPQSNVQSVEPIGQIDSHQSDNKVDEIDTDMAAVGENGETRVSDQSRANIGSRIISAITTQPIHTDPDIENNPTPSLSIYTNGNKANDGQSGLIVSQTTTPVSSVVPDIKATPEVANKQLRMSSAVTEDSASSALPVEMASCTPSDVATTQDTVNATTELSDLPKIAVILRFALETSQYATIVVRELQGSSTAKK